MISLTQQNLNDILIPLSKKTKAGTINSQGGVSRLLNSNGVKTPIHGVFYCPQKIFTALVRPILWWRVVGCRKAGRTHCPVLITHYASPPKNHQHFGGGLLSDCNGVTAMSSCTPNPANSGQSSILLSSELERLSGLLKVLNASASLCQSSGSLFQCEIKNPSDFETLERYLGYLVEDCYRLREAAQQLGALIKEIGQ